MKKKSLITILVVALVAILSLTALVACDNKDKHEFATEWTTDATSHWHVCTVEGHTDTDEKVAHTFDEGKITTAATEDAEGVKTFTCSVCGYTKTEKVEKLAHVHSFVDFAEVPATCTEAGNVAYKHCSGCNKNFDADGNEIADVTIAATGHTYGDWIAEVPATCATAGTKAHKDCSVCDKHFDNEGNEITDLAISATGHTYGKTTLTFNPWINAEPDCVATRVCSNCDETTEGHKIEITVPATEIIVTQPTCKELGGFKLVATFTEDQKTLLGLDNVKQTSSDEWWWNEGGFAAHTYGDWIAEVPATCTTAGTKAHKDCSVCNKHFDNEGNEITDLAISATGHTYGKTTLTFNPWINAEPDCVATRVCSNCDETTEGHKIEITVPATEIIVTQPTCKELGGFKLVATFTEDQKTLLGLDNVKQTSSDEWWWNEGGFADHTLIDVEAKDATYSETGIKVAHKYCTVCEKHFDADGKELSESDYLIAKLEAKARMIKFITVGGAIPTKQWDGQPLSIDGKYTVSTDSTETKVTEVDSGKVTIKYYTCKKIVFDASAETELASAPTEAGSYWVYIELSATDEWQKVSAQTRFIINCDHNYGTTGVCSTCGGSIAQEINGTNNETDFQLKMDSSTSKKVYFNFVNCVSNTDCDLDIDTKTMQETASSTDDALISSIKVYKEDGTEVCALTCEKFNSYLHWVLPDGITLEDYNKYYVVAEFKEYSSTVTLGISAKVHSYNADGDCEYEK